MKFLSVSLVVGFLAVSLNAAPVYKKVPLTCTNPGSHQDVAKTPLIKNTTLNSLSESVKVYWTATDGDSGFVMGPFAINETKQGLGNAGNSYQCEAYYLVRIRW